MKITKLGLAALAAVLLIFYWVPAILIPDLIRPVVNGAYFGLALMTTMLLVGDVLDIIQRDGDGISWQAASAKIGIFTLALAFTLGRAWAFMLNFNDFPDDMLRSPVGTFFTYLQGAGMAGVFFGFSNAGNITPQITPRTTLILALVCGVAIGLALGHVQF